ncbi:HlyD family type I secretion periplasmic adaptor subunit [Terasakiella sp. SH-1]|uniref:HlyD family type I secretion periplasmic adaptor subunit n=1 Tax=Terasakiella sp. SH-1 TaxID=2560057 RepID=UPI00107325F0|nr:HlyD family type I secretion periplasmic adaptor subunit [Terasakiella sp. SH-1]
MSVWENVKERFFPDWLFGLIAGAKHHAHIARESWQQENEKEKVKKDRHELAFLPASLEIMETPAHPIGRAVALTIASFFTLAILWAVFGSIDIVATTTGKIVPTERTKTVQPLESGIVRAIHVRDGQVVQAGETLIELDPTDTQADLERLKKEFLNARLNVARLSALLETSPQKAYQVPEGAPKRLAEMYLTQMLSQWEKQKAEAATIRAEVAQRQAELVTVNADINRLDKILPKVRQRVNARRALVDKGISSRTDFLELEQELVEYEGQLAVQRAKVIETEATLGAAQSRLQTLKAEFRRTILTELVEAEQQVSTLEQELIKAKERARHQKLIAPVAGKVQELAIHTVGGVVTPAQELLSIVPADSGLEIEVKVLNKDIGFVHEDQEVEIKVDSFPFTKYGTIAGKLLSLSLDSVEDEQQGLVYPARISMAETQIHSGNKMVDLTPGMSVTVEIKTGKRKLIEYLLAPLQEYQDESLRER